MSSLPHPPALLTDLSRLPEIYALRVAAWEQSPGAQYVNRELFPQGWSDALDTHATARHWVVEDGGRIVAAARVVLLDTVEETGQPNFTRFDLPLGRPFCYYSRLVMLPIYRKTGLSLLFDQVRMAYLRNTETAFAIATTNYKRLPDLLNLGWTHFGDMPFVANNSAPQLASPLCLWQPNALLASS